MKKFILPFLLLLISTSLFSQKTGIAYQNFFDLFEEQGDTITKLKVQKRKKGKVYMYGGGDYKIFTKDEMLDEVIKKNYAAIKVDNSLYVNVKKLSYKKASFGNWYASAFTINDKIYIYSIPVVSNGSAVATGAMFGLVGGAIGATRNFDRIYYELSPEEENFEVVDVAKMGQLLMGNSVLLSAYYQEKDAAESKVIGKYLKLLKEYEDKGTEKLQNE